MNNNNFRVTPDMWATKGQRFLNYLIDWGLQYGVGLFIGFTIALVAIAMGNTTIVEDMESFGRIEEYLLGVVIMLLYYTLCEMFLSRTIAKYITKTIVVMGDGSKPDSGTIIKRSLCRVIPFNALSFLASDRGWHDSISDTYVVQKDLFEEKKRLFYSFDEIGQSVE